MVNPHVRRLTVMLHADVISSTTLVQKDEALAHQRMRDAFHKFSTTIESYGGKTLELRGDALLAGDYLFKSRNRVSIHLSTRQYARRVNAWVRDIGLDPAEYGTHSMRRTKASLIYRRTKNLRAVQILLGHRKMESTVRYLGIEVEDALELAEQTEI